MWKLFQITVINNGRRGCSSTWHRGCTNWGRSRRRRSFSTGASLHSTAISPHQGERWHDWTWLLVEIVVMDDQLSGYQWIVLVFHNPKATWPRGTLAERLPRLSGSSRSTVVFQLFIYYSLQHIFQFTSQVSYPPTTKCEGPHHLPVWDFRQEAARNHWIAGQSLSFLAACLPFPLSSQSFWNLMPPLPLLRELGRSCIKSISYIFGISMFFISSRSPFTCDSKQWWGWWGFSWWNRCVSELPEMLSMVRIQNWHKIVFFPPWGSSHARCNLLDSHL